MAPHAPPQNVYRCVDPNCVPLPYPARINHLPTSMELVNAAWLSEMQSYKYPSGLAPTIEALERPKSHTTNWRLTVDRNQVAVAAGLQRNLAYWPNSRGPNGMRMNERLFVAAEGYGTWKLQGESPCA